MCTNVCMAGNAQEKVEHVVKTLYWTVINLMSAELKKYWTNVINTNFYEVSFVKLIFVCYILRVIFQYV